MAFEEHMKQLRELTQKLEQGNLPLEEAVTTYTEGMKLAAKCQKELQTAKLKIEKQTTLVQKEDKTDGSEVSTAS